MTVASSNYEYLTEGNVQDVLDKSRVVFENLALAQL